MLNLGLELLDAAHVHAMFDAIDLNESGSITFKELNKALRRSPAAEAARAAKRAAARALAAEQAAESEELAELGELRGNVKDYVRDVAETADKEEMVLKGLAADLGSLQGEPAKPQRANVNPRFTATMPLLLCQPPLTLHQPPPSSLLPQTRARVGSG